MNTDSFLFWSVLDLELGVVALLISIVFLVFKKTVKHLRFLKIGLWLCFVSCYFAIGYYSPTSLHFLMYAALCTPVMLLIYCVTTRKDKEKKKKYKKASIVLLIVAVLLFIVIAGSGHLTDSKQTSGTTLSTQTETSVIEGDGV